MKVLIVSQYFWPEEFLINDLVKNLVKSKKVYLEVLTGKPNYPSGVFFKDYEMNPEKYSFYGETKIHRVKIFPRGKNNKFKLALNYFSFVISASIKVLFDLRHNKYDLIFVYEPSPITVCLPAILLKKLTKIPIIFWVLDLWPATLKSLNVIRSRFILSMIDRLVRFIYKNCDLILGQSRSFVEEISRYVNQNKVEYFPNWVESAFEADMKLDFNDIEMNARYATEFNSYFTKREFKVLFAGNVGEAQDFDSIIETAKLIKINKMNACIYVLGDGRMLERSVKRVLEEGLHEQMKFLGRYNATLMPLFYDTADSFLVSLRNSQVFSMTIPAKIQSYMHAGKPILSMLSGEGYDTINTSQSGLAAQSGDYSALYLNIEKLSKMPKDKLLEMGENGKKYAKREFSPLVLTNRLIEFFNQVRI